VGQLERSKCSKNKYQRRPFCVSLQFSSLHSIKDKKPYAENYLLNLEYSLNSFQFSLIFRKYPTKSLNKKSEDYQQKVCAVRPKINIFKIFPQYDGSMQPAIFAMCVGGMGVGSLPFLMADFMAKKISFSGRSLGHAYYTLRGTRGCTTYVHYRVRVCKPFRSSGIDSKK
jgi:hypothetical protein